MLTNLRDALASAPLPGTRDSDHMLAAQDRPTIPVPAFDAPELVTCDDCDGKGHGLVPFANGFSEMFRDKVCVSCAGTGHVEVS